MASGGGDTGVGRLLAALAVVEAERHAVEAGEIGPYLEVLTADAIFMPPSAASKTGAELRTWLAEFLAGFRIEWLSFVTTEIQVAENLGYHAFTYTWRATPRSGGEGRLSSGKGVHLLRCEEDGSWRIAREIWNASPDDPT